MGVSFVGFVDKFDGVVGIVSTPGALPADALWHAAV